MKLSLNNGFAMKRWPEPEAWAAVIGERLSCDDVQISLDLVDLEGPASSIQEQARRIRSACLANGVVASSAFSGLGHYCRNLLAHPDEDQRRSALEQYKRAIDFCAELEVDTFGGHIGAMSVRDHNNPKRRDSLRQQQLAAVSELAVHAEMRGLRHVLWEPMPVEREWPSTLDECANLAERFCDMPGAQLGYCLDVGHTCRHDLSPEDRDPYRWVRELAYISPIIHLQQTDGLGDRHWPFTAKTNKDGIIHPAQLRQALDIADRSIVTHLTFEVFPAFEQPDEAVVDDLRETMTYWRDGGFS